MRIAIGGIVKNEAPYLLDWIAWHRALGVDDFIIAENDSDDGTREILDRLAARGIVTVIPFPTRKHRSPQLEAYAHIAMRAKRCGVDWIAFIDADEFVVPAAPADDFRGWLAGMPQDVGAVALNWAIYGSSGRVRAIEAPVFEAFRMRGVAALGEQHVFGGNHHYKSVLRPAACSGVVSNPHHLELRAPYRAVYADGGALTVIERGIATDVIWAPFRVNHYTIKSWSEFVQKKLARNLADLPHLSRKTEFFQHHDFNDVDDPAPAWVAAEALRRKAVLLRELGPVADVYHRSVRSIVAFEPPPIPAWAPGTGDSDEAATRAPAALSPWARRWRRIVLKIAAFVAPVRTNRGRRPRDW